MRALAIGAAGQDGSYLVEQLAGAGHEVWGATRRFTGRHAQGRHVYVDLTDQESIEQALELCEPDIVFNVAAVTAPGGGWRALQPPLLAETTGLGVLHLVNAIMRCAPDARLVHASSSAIYDVERYGPYGAAKRFAHDVIKGARAGGLWASSAILFSHTSPRQSERFLIRRICSTLARIANGSDEKLILGDVGPRRDWGYAPDYCDAMRLIGEQDEPRDWTVSTQEQHSVREVVDVALTRTGLAWGDVIEIDPALPLVPDERAPWFDHHVSELGWKPTHGFTEIIHDLVEAGSA